MGYVAHYIGAEPSEEWNLPPPPKFPTPIPPKLIRPLFPEDACEVLLREIQRLEQQPDFSLSASDGAEISRYADDLRDDRKASRLIELLNAMFPAALAWAGHDQQSPAPRDLRDYYASVIDAARRLTEAIGGDHTVTREHAWEWVKRGAQPVSGNPSLSALADLARLFTSPEYQEQIRNDFRELGVSERSPEWGNFVAQATTEAACDSLSALLPNALHLLSGLCQRAHDLERPVANKTNYERTFLREVFLGLFLAHQHVFGRPPEIRDNEREPGAGTVWARAILQMAARHIQSSLVPRERSEVRPEVLAIRVASTLTPETIAGRLRGSGNQLRSPQELEWYIRRAGIRRLLPD